MIRSLLLLVLFIFTASSLALADSRIERLPSVHYSASEDRLSVDAQNAPLRTVLQEISRQASLDIDLDRSINKQISIHLDDKPLEQALAYLLKGMNVFAVYADNRDKRTTHSLLTLRVLPNGKNQERFNNDYAIRDAATSINPVNTLQPEFIDATWESQVENFSPELKNIIKTTIQRAQLSEKKPGAEQERLQNAIQKQLFEYAVASQMLEEALQKMDRN